LEREAEHLELARQYLAALEAGAVGDDLARFFAPDVQQIEYPNRLVPQGATRGLDQLLEGASRGRQILRGQRFEVRAAHATGDVVILEVLWVGRLAMTIGRLGAGDDMRAHFCVVLEFRDRLIVRQRNYDCFDPF
jgi:ketosteroid isomerase-like protein